MIKRSCYLSLVAAGFAVAQGPWLPVLPDRHPLTCSPVNSEANLKQVLRTNHIICRTDSQISIFIPANEVTRIEYDFISLATPNRQSASWDYLSGGLPGMMALPVVYGIETAINAAKMQQRYYVFLSWSSGGIERTAIFRLQDKMLVAFVQRLSVATGKPWKDRFHKRNEPYREQRLEAVDQRFKIRFPTPVRIGSSDIPPGFYELVVLAGASGDFRLYVSKQKRFGGGRTLTQVRVNVERAAENEGYRVIYTTSDTHIQRVIRIRTPRTIIRVKEPS